MFQISVLLCVQRINKEHMHSIKEDKGSTYVQINKFNTYGET